MPTTSVGMAPGTKVVPRTFPRPKLVLDHNPTKKDGPAVSHLFTTYIDDRKITCTSLLIDYVQDQTIPVYDNRIAWGEFSKFIVQRSQNVLGKWPVHVIPIATANSDEPRFTGFRVFAKCSSFRPDEPNMIEYGILVWHESVPMTIIPPAITGVNWAAFAEAIEV